jgi:hypothetical protein
MSDTKSGTGKQRRDHNKELLRRMNNGESLTTFSNASSWFPPRPVIEKDRKLMVKLYGETAIEESTEPEKGLRLADSEETTKSKEKKKADGSNVVPLRSA